MSKPGASFNLNWNGMDRVIGSAVAKAQQTQNLMEQVGEVLVSSTAERFEKGEGPDGTPWKASKRADKDGGQTLVDDGILHNSVGYQASPGHVEVGSNDVRARIHQLGGKTGRGHKTKLPARPYLGISEEDIKEARELIADHMAVSIGLKR